MTTEKQFNQYITKQFYEYYKGKVVTQRIETTTGNGVPDLLILTQDKTWLIESKFETTRLRPEQQAWQIKTNAIPTNAVVVTLSAYPKTKRLVVQKYSMYDQDKREFVLDNEGFKEFINYFQLASKLV